MTPAPDPAGGRADAAPVAAAVEAARAALDAVKPDLPAQALPLLREAHEHVTKAIDEAMAAVVVSQAGSIRNAGSLAGLSENAVGPRLARTTLLGAYGSDAGRVTASGVDRARYDLEEGRHRSGDEGAGARPLRFRARRPLVTDDEPPRTTTRRSQHDRPEPDPPLLSARPQRFDGLHQERHRGRLQRLHHRSA